MKQLLIIIGLMATCSLTADNKIINDTFWNTTKGTPIYSQGGGIFRFPDANGVEHYRLSAPQRGVNVVRKMVNGKIRSYKVVTN